MAEQGSLASTTRTKNHRWKDSGGTLLAGWSYDYDRIGNKDYQEDLKDSTESELYDYDAGECKHSVQFGGSTRLA